MRSAFLISGLTLLATAAMPRPATAGPMVVAWTTWIRAAPSEQARAIDEIGTGTPVQIDTCQNGWCRIIEARTTGYIQQRTLATALQTLRPGTGECFQAQYYTAENPLPITLCPAKLSSPSPPNRRPG
jgi:hypothetical protein